MNRPLPPSLRVDNPPAVLVSWLRRVAGDPNKPEGKRQKALYVISCYEVHCHPIRLMAHILELTRGNYDLPKSGRIGKILTDADAPVVRHSKEIQKAVADFQVTFTAADFEGHPVEIVSIIPRHIENALEGENALKLHEKVLLYEKCADMQIARYVAKFGYHPIFRAGLRHYYMT
jgi:hypothetical protein